VLADKADNKSKEAIGLATVIPTVFAVIAIVAFALTLKHSTVGPALPTVLAPSKDNQKMYTALILEDVANMEPSKLLAAGQVDEAIGEANKEMQEKPNDLETIMCVGNVLAEKGDKQRGLDLLKQACVLSKDSRYVRINYARHLSQAGRTDDAIKEYDSLCKNTAKQWLDPRIELQAIYMQRGNATEAANLQKTILEFDPENAAVKRAYCFSMAKTGQEDAGFEAFSKLCALPKDQQPYAENCRQVLKANGGSSRKAVSQLKDDIALRQKQIRPRLALIELYLYLNRPKDVKEVFDAAIKVDPKSAAAHALMAETNVRLKDNDAAKEEFKKSVALTFSGKH
jgi:Tfp pilus assembly protein PilF